MKHVCNHTKNISTTVSTTFSAQLRVIFVLVLRALQKAAAQFHNLRVTKYSCS